MAKNINILIHAEDLLVDFIDVNNDKNKMTIYVRKNEAIGVTLPKGEYKMKYIGGRSWCGLQDGFRSVYLQGESNQNIKIQDSTELYFGEALIGGRYWSGPPINIKVLNKAEWDVTLRMIEKEKEREVSEQLKKEQVEYERKINPNYDLKLNDTRYDFLIKSNASKKI